MTQTSTLVPKVGTRYEVVLSDCCIAGVEFTATLTAIASDWEDGEMAEPMFWGLTFDNGVTIDSGYNGGVILEEAS